MSLVRVLFAHLVKPVEQLCKVGRLCPRVLVNEQLDAPHRVDLGTIVLSILDKRFVWRLTLPLGTPLRQILCFRISHCRFPVTRPPSFSGGTAEAGTSAPGGHCREI